jgi:hypothetical protein
VTPAELWRFLLPNYLLTILIETPILLIGLSRIHPIRRRLFAGVWLTACTYPVVVLVLPLLLDMNAHRTRYLIVAEIFAPAAECLLFSLAVHAGRRVSQRDRLQDFAAIVVANLASFGIGVLMDSLSR